MSETIGPLVNKILAAGEKVRLPELIIIEFGEIRTKDEFLHLFSGYKTRKLAFSGKEPRRGFLFINKETCPNHKCLIRNKINFTINLVSCLLKSSRYVAFYQESFRPELFNNKNKGRDEDRWQKLMIICRIFTTLSPKINPKEPPISASIALKL